VLDGGVLIALDGVWFHSSERVHGDHCLHVTRNGKTTYYHSMTASVMARPGGEVVLPLAPEMIRNEDKERPAGSYEQQKQDCERKAAHRLLEKHGVYYKALNATLLGDDVYATKKRTKSSIKTAGYLTKPSPKSMVSGWWNAPAHGGKLRMKTIRS
jgi:hypothetical protein